MMTLLSLQYLLLVLSLWSVQLLQWLVSLLLPSASQLLAKVTTYLEGRKREELLRQEEAAHRSGADKAAARFVEERAWQYAQLHRHGDMGMCLWCSLWVWSYIGCHGYR